MIDPYMLKILARLSMALLAAGTLCTLLKHFTEWALGESWIIGVSKGTPNHWRFMSLVLNTTGIGLGLIVANQVARLW